MVAAFVYDGGFMHEIVFHLYIILKAKIVFLKVLRETWMMFFISVCTKKSRPMEDGFFRFVV